MHIMKTQKNLLWVALALILSAGIFGLYRTDFRVEKASAAIDNLSVVSDDSPVSAATPEPDSGPVFANTLGHLAYCPIPAVPTPKPAPSTTTAAASSDNMCRLAFCSIPPEPTAETKP